MRQSYRSGFIRVHLRPSAVKTPGRRNARAQKRKSGRERPPSRTQAIAGAYLAGGRTGVAALLATAHSGKFWFALLSFFSAIFVFFCGCPFPLLGGAGVPFSSSPLPVNSTGRGRGPIPESRYLVSYEMNHTSSERRKIRVIRSHPRLNGLSICGRLPLCPPLTRTGATPVGVDVVRGRLPKVARASQPWALGRDPVGVGKRCRASLAIAPGRSREAQAANSSRHFNRESAGMNADMDSAGN
jgi:hypothetical protein